MGAVDLINSYIFGQKFSIGQISGYMIRFQLQGRLKASFGLQSFVQSMKGFFEDVEDTLDLVIDGFCRILCLTNFDPQTGTNRTKPDLTGPNRT